MNKITVTKNNTENNAEKWYALRVPYGRELKLKALLDTFNISNFVPVRYRKKIVKGKETTVRVSAISNLLFIHTTYSIISKLKLQLETTIPFRFIMDRASKSPVTVPDKEMEYFIAISGSMDEQVMYLTEVKQSLLQGDKVRVTGGAFSGIEGRVVRIKKDRRVMVMLNSDIAIVTGFINLVFLEKIDC